MAASNLTILLPLKGRHLHTLRFLWDANRRKLPYKFLIADGEVNSTIAGLLEAPSKVFPDLDIEYVNVKLPGLDDDNEQRRRIATLCRDALGDLPLRIPEESSSGKHVYHLFVVALEQRDKLQSYLRNDGIAAGIHYPLPSHRHPAFSRFVTNELPVTESVVRRILTLPMYPELGDEDVLRREFDKSILLRHPGLMLFRGSPRSNPSAVCVNCAVKNEHSISQCPINP